MCATIHATRDTRLMFYKVMAILAPLYRSETWVDMKPTNSRMNNAEMRINNADMRFFRLVKRIAYGTTISEMN